MKLFNYKRKIKSQAVQISGFLPAKQSPDELLGELFQDVQLRRVYPDGMTFVDLVPAGKLQTILNVYEKQRQRPDFDLHAFVQKHFKDYLANPTGYKTNPNHTIEEHINELWDILIHEQYRDKGSLIALPHPYIVPGGRFGAQWYWDSYFVMLGLAESNRYDLLEGIIKNFAFLIRKVGYIPSGNRTYYLSRSQPPFFAHMVHLLADKKGKLVLVRYLPYLLAEYRFWMKGARNLNAEDSAYRRVVLLPDGSLLNRYYDNKQTPRPEMYKEDVDTASLAPERLASKMYLDIRAAAESGWDFSSRWFKDGVNLQTIHTTDILPIDLNCLLFYLEKSIADIYRMTKQTWMADKYEKRSIDRRAAIDSYLWNQERGFYFDYDFVARQQTSSVSAAALFPLYVKIATQTQADLVALMVERVLLKEGGLDTTTVSTGQQWDSPNGWAPLQWVAIVGLRNYGHNKLAEEIKRRWINTNTKMYKHQGKLVEKYNVVDVKTHASGGEYELQDGFGWTNGVLLKLLAEDRPSDG
ncbi:MAG TPA: alpha,alpha-trehalase TreF [Patescibacteria group bacterium]|jgi:alpha,alpha-trehalase|nr:alpha,alpha-trehalase TreF [Patescibacteria group bacterium]